LAVAELERLHNSLGFRGIEIMDACRRRGFVGRAVPPIFARCEELGMLIFMHPDGFTEARRFHDHYFANVIGNPLDTTVAVHHLIFGGVLDAYPGLRSCSPMAAAICRPILGASITAASARPDTCECIKEMPTTYLKRLYFDSLVYTPPPARISVAQYGADHILVGTDYPADMGEIDPVGFIEGAPGLDDATRRAILVVTPRGCSVSRFRPRSLDSIQPKGDKMSVRTRCFDRRRPGQGRRVCSSVQQALRDSRKDAGCLQFEIFRSVSNPDKFALLSCGKARRRSTRTAKLNQSRAPLQPGLRAGGGEREDYEYKPRALNCRRALRRFAGHCRVSGAARQIGSAAAV